MVFTDGGGNGRKLCDIDSLLFCYRLRPCISPIRSKWIECLWQRILRGNTIVPAPYTVQAGVPKDIAKLKKTSLARARKDAPVYQIEDNRYQGIYVQANSYFEGEKSSLRTRLNG